MKVFFYSREVFQPYIISLIPKTKKNQHIFGGGICIGSFE